jgi:hypothetical protein
MGKKEKKHKKEEKTKKKSKKRDGAADSDAAAARPSQELSHAMQKNESNQSDNTKSIPISVSININTSNNVKPQSSGGWSWGASFAAASTIRPNEDDLDDDFLERTKASDAVLKADGGLGNISSLAKGYMPKESDVHSLQSKGADAESDSDKDDAGDASVKSEEGPLEGRMIALSSDSADQTLVLVDKQHGKIYSSGTRGKDGRRLVIGKIVDGNIQLDRDALKEMKQLEDNGADVQDFGPLFPYPTNPDDHCETPMQSYRDIVPVLDELCKCLGKKKTTLKIYDPYYCNGSVVNHLESLGYTHVYNRKEDCYAVWESKKEPSFDVLLTNPPYSNDHIDKLMRYLISSTFDKPFLLLMPQWVHKKDYYINATTGGEQTQGKKRKRGKFDKSCATKCNPFFVVPKKRYVYLPPPDFREKKVSDVHKKSSPFTSMWFVWGGTHERNEALMDAFRKSDVKGCELARSRSALRDLRRGGKKKARTDK